MIGAQFPWVTDYQRNARQTLACQLEKNLDNLEIKNSLTCCPALWLQGTLEQLLLQHLITCTETRQKQSSSISTLPLSALNMVLYF